MNRYESRLTALETYLDDETGELVGQFYIRNTLVLVPNKNMDIARANPRLRHIHGRFFFDDPKTERSKGYVTLPADTVEELIIHRFRQGQKKLRVREYFDYDLVFPTSLRTPLGPKGLDDIYDLLIKKAGVPKIKFHALRHIHAPMRRVYLWLASTSGPFRIGCAIAQRRRRSTAT